MPQIEVSFDIDADGILHVSAKDKQSNKEQKIRIEASSALSETDINKAIKDAEDHKEEDQKIKEKIDLKNETEALIFRAEKSLKDYGDKVADDIKTAIQEAIDKSKEALKTDDNEQIRQARDHLNSTIQKIGESMRQDTPQSEPEETQAENATAEAEEVKVESETVETEAEDADVEEVSDAEKK